MNELLQGRNRMESEPSPPHISCLFLRRLRGHHHHQPYPEDRAKAAFRSAAKVHKWAISEP